MGSAVRALSVAARSFERQARDAGDEFRERRLGLSLSQDHVATAVGMHRNRYGRIENGRCESLTLAEINRISAVLGLAPSVRIYPAGPAVRDAAHAARLQAFLAAVQPPLTYGIEVPLPQVSDHTEVRAWDSVIFGLGQRTAIELEMRIRDVQAVRRRVDLKRRDDPTEAFLLLVADTRSNRRILDEFRSLLADLPRVRISIVRGRLQAGQHPPTSMVLI